LRAAAAGLDGVTNLSVVVEQDDDTTAIVAKSGLNMMFTTNATANTYNFG
jgi:hypothetical protein